MEKIKLNRSVIDALPYASVNLSSMTIAEASKFLDPFFSDFNILQVKVLSPLVLTDNSFITDLISLSIDKCSVIIVQKIEDSRAHCTFVTKLSSSQLRRYLIFLTDYLKNTYGRKEVYIYV